MALCVVHVCGPRRAGKTTAALRLAPRLGTDKPYHLRLIPSATATAAPLTIVSMMDGMRETRQVMYTPERIFEQLPAALKTIKLQRRWATVLLETDADPGFRHAGPFDVRLFVAPAARDVHEVFRTPAEAALAMNQIMQDTFAFAQEIYGLIPDATLDESRSGLSAKAALGGGRAPGDPLSDTHMRNLLSSTVGGEIAARVQFQPDYHAIVESDVVVINTARGGTGEAVDQVAERVEKVLSKLPHPAGREPLLAVCDVADEEDPMQQLALGRLAALVAEAKADWP